MTNKLHWYCFTFYEVQGNTISHSSVYGGYLDQNVTMFRIEEARTNAKTSSGSTLLSCSYLGHMTSEHFRSGE